MLAGDLVNDLDGTWHHGSNFVAGNWEISLGRGLLRYFDKLRFGVEAVPFIAVLTFLEIGFSIALVAHLFSIKSKIVILLLALSVTASPVVCATLSYCYTAADYGMAFFSVLSAYCVVNIREVRGWLSISGGLCLAAAMALYQAYIGVTCLLVLLMICKMLIERTEAAQIRKLVLASLFSGLLGGLFYYALTQIILLRAGISLETYKGAANVNIGNMIRELPVSIRQAYRQYLNYFIKGKMYLPVAFIEVLMLCIVLFFLGAFGIQLIKLFFYKKSYAIAFLLCTGLIPVACNGIVLIAVGNAVTILMSMGMAVSVILIYILVLREGRSGWWMKQGYCFLVALLCWFSLVSATNDQLALKAGKRSTMTLAESIAGSLVAEDCLRGGCSVAIVGIPSENPLFVQNMAFQTANAYARYGNFDIEPGNYRRSWEGVFLHYCGISVNLCSEEQYERVREMEMVREMPLYPEKGSIKRNGDVVIVKIAEVY